MSKEHSYYSDLLKSVADQKDSQGISVSTIPSVMARGDGSTLFEEGELFSGNVLKGEAEVSLTLSSSPHFYPSIPSEDFRQEAQKKLGRKVSYPHLVNPDSKVAPHLLLWWRKNKMGVVEDSDLFSLYSISPTKRTDYLGGLEAQTARAINILEGFPGSSVVYGTWGFATIDERAKLGLSRGGPTMKQGHMHIAKIYEPDQAITVRDDLDPGQVLKHYAPWNHLFNANFGEEVAQIIEKHFSQSSIAESRVEFSNRTLVRENRPNTTMGSYEITYRSPIPFEEALSHVINIAGRSELLYQQLLGFYRDYHIAEAENSDLQDLVSSMRLACMQFGFSEKSAENLSKFILRIVPTNGQLEEWDREIKRRNIEAGHPIDTTTFEQMINERNDRLKRMHLQTNSKSIRRHLVIDTYKDPTDTSITHTFPVHSSGAYLLEDFSLDKDRVNVSKITFLPALVSTAGAPEKILGVEIIRDIGGNVKT